MFGLRIIMLHILRGRVLMQWYADHLDALREGRELPKKSSTWSGWRILDCYCKVRTTGLAGGPDC